MILQRLTSIWDWSSLDELLFTKKNSFFSFILKWENWKSKGEQKLTIFYSWSEYIFWNKKYSNKDDLRKELVRFLNQYALLKEEKEVADIIMKEPSFEPKKEEKWNKRSSLEENHKRVIWEVQGKLKFWSNPKLQRIPLWLGGTGLVASTLLPGGLGFASIVLWVGVLFLWWDYIWKKMDIYKLKLEKLKKIHY